MTRVRHTAVFGIFLAARTEIDRFAGIEHTESTALVLFIETSTFFQVSETVISQSPLGLSRIRTAARRIVLDIAVGFRAELLAHGGILYGNFPTRKVIRIFHLLPIARHIVESRILRKFVICHDLSHGDYDTAGGTSCGAQVVERIILMPLRF